MEKDIEEVIDRIYNKQDIEFYLSKCRENFELNLQAIYVIKKFEFAYKQFKNDFWPSVSFTIDFGNFEEGNFKVQYKGELIFSKLVKAYSLEFIYDINNPDPDRYMPEFYYGDDEPLTVKQADFLDEFTLALEKQGYKRLLKPEREQILENLNYSTPNSLYHGKVDLWTALTFDVLDKTED